MGFRTEGIGRTGGITPRNLRLPTTPEEWLEAAKSGKVSFRTVMAQIDKIPLDEQDAIVAACTDKPGF